jgi:hypothetical protein
VRAKERMGIWLRFLLFPEDMPLLKDITEEYSQ